MACTLPVSSSARSRRNINTARSGSARGSRSLLVAEVTHRLPCRRRRDDENDEDENEDEDKEKDDDDDDEYHNGQFS